MLGVAAAGLYGLLAVSLVLTYRVSRTIGFVHGGIAVFAAHFYWWLTYDSGVRGRFNPNASSESWPHGIMGMQHRVRALGGRFSLESAPGKGTTLRVAVPTAAPATAKRR